MATRDKKNPFLVDGKNPFAPEKGDSKLLGAPGQITIGGKTKALPGPPLSIMQTVAAPQQAVLRGIKGIGEAATGDFGAAGKEFGKGLLEIGSLGQARGDISVTGALEPLGVKKLPFGLETVGQIATDPLTFTTFGTGSVAKAGLKATEEVLGAAGRQAVRQGGLKALTKTEQAAVRKHIFETAAKDIGEKKAKKVADAQMQALKSRAKGGVGLHLPGTKFDVRVPGLSRAEQGPLASILSKDPTSSKVASLFTGKDVVADRLEMEAARAAAAKEARAKGFAPGTAPHTQPRLFDVEDVPARETLFDVSEYGVPKPKDVGQGSLLGRAAEAAPTPPRPVQGQLFEPPKGGGIVQAAKEVPVEQANKFAKIHNQLDELAKKPHDAPGFISKAWRRAAITYPGTVVNRLRQAAFYGAAAGMRPDTWVRNMERGRRNYMAYEKIAKELGEPIAEESGKFIARLEKAIGPQAAKEEIAFRKYAEEPTIFKNIEESERKTKLGKVLEKGRLVKKGGKKIREAGNAVEEASRRAHFLHYAESRYGNFAEAGEQTRYFMPGVKTMSVAEQKIQRALPFWTAIRADAQAVLRQAGESPGRVSALTQLGSQLGGAAGLPGGGTFDFSQLQERHMPPLELAKLLNIPVDVAKLDFNNALMAVSEMTGGPGVAVLEQAFTAWQNKNRDIPEREQAYRFLKAVSPYLSRLPTSVEKFVAGKELTKTDKSAMEALLQIATGLKAKTGATEGRTAEEQKAAKSNPFAAGGTNPFAPK